MNFKKLALAIAIASTLSGCAENRFEIQNHSKAEKKFLNEQEITKQVTTVSRLKGNYIAAVSHDYHGVSNGSVTLKFNSIPVADALKSVTDTIGYSIQLSPDVDDKRKASINIKNSDPFTAIREIAYSAGLVAIANKDHKTITLASEGSYTYRLPMELLKNRTSKFSASNAPSGGGSSSSAGAGMPSAGGGSGGGSTSAGAFSVSGGSNYTSEKLIEYITKVSEAKVTALPEFGTITVYGNALQLRRADEKLMMYAKDAMIQVEVEVSIIDVSLNRNFQYGIDWTKVLPGGAFGSGTPATLNVTQTATVISPSIITNFGIGPTAVIKALDQLTDVDVISKPKLVAQNHVPEVIFTGTSQPYLGGTTSSVTTGGASTGAQLSWALDGVSLSLEANVIDSTHIEIMILSVVNNISSFQNFAGGLSAPIQPVKQSTMQVIAENGHTMIIGGTRINSKQSMDSGIPGFAGVPILGKMFGSNISSNNKEVVILLNAKIIPAKKIDLIIGESL